MDPIASPRSRPKVGLIYRVENGLPKADVRIGICSEGQQLVTRAQQLGLKIVEVAEPLRKPGATNQSLSDVFL